MSAAQAAFGVDATVTVPGRGPVDTTVFWLPSTTEDFPTGQTFARSEQRRVLVIPVVDVAEVPRLTLVSCAEADGMDPAEWRVEESERVDYDHHRAIVIRAPEV